MFGFSPSFIAIIQVLYRDIESFLKMSGGLSAPFKVQRGIRQGCSLSGMLYSLAIEPFLHRLRRLLPGVALPGCNSVFKLSAYADDVVIFVKNQDDINSLVECINDFNVLSSAKINWGKIEAISFGAELVKKTVLPNGLSWVKGGFKYLGVFLGDHSFVCRNWDNVLGKIEGRLKKWKWILPTYVF